MVSIPSMLISISSFNRINFSKCFSWLTGHELDDEQEAIESEAEENNY